jgi:hypothetical protein
MRGTRQAAGAASSVQEAEATNTEQAASAARAEMVGVQHPALAVKHPLSPVTANV